MESLKVAKNIVVGVSFIGSVLAYLIFQSRTLDVCDIYCGDALGEYHNVFLFMPFVFVFSLATYFASEQIFQGWWRFARVAAPVVLALSFLINLELHHNPAGEMQNIFDAPVLWTLYILFSIGSAVAIYRGYRQG